MKKFWIKLGVFSFAGALLGFAYYYFIGCRTGACPITSNPFISTAYGSLMGFVLGFDTRIFKRQNSTEQDKE
jgi:hypothetical protein